MKKADILVFGGTIEGRRVSDYLNEKQMLHTLCVATEYGEEVLTAKPYLQIHQGRLNQEQMKEFMLQGKYRLVIDATHPYAAVVSENIRTVSAALKIPYLRYLRPQAGWEDAPDGYVMVDSTLEAAKYLEKQEGQIFLTTGSKELHIFTENVSDKSRLFARVLPTPEVIASCRELGLEGKQICGMQGPFSTEINEAMLRQTKAEFLVTKDTGVSGGFPEKMEAARRTGVKVVIVRRPEEKGNDWEEVVEQLEVLISQLQLKKTGSENISEKSEEQPLAETNVRQGVRRISCIGIGMGTIDTLTHASAKEIRDADIIFGAKRILDSTISMLKLHPIMDENVFVAGQQMAVVEYVGEKIYQYLEAHPHFQRIVILMSGDVGFYSGARGIQKAFGSEKVEYFCGISSVVYFASKIPTSWQDAKLVSAHGKELAVLNHIKRYPKLIMLVSGREDVQRICRELSDAEQDQVRVTVGTNLSYPEEQVVSGHPKDFINCPTTGLHIMMLENPEARFVITPGIPDEEFVRGKVPMTKEEIRILSLAKLQLTNDAVIYDVGAGTGSVSIEAARLCTDGKVYAIERNPEGIGLIHENCRKLGISNLITVEGVAPEAMTELPAPTHAFIGGSAGNMKQIIELLIKKNPHVRIVINTIALESIAEVMNLIKELEIKDTDIVQVSAAKSRVLGRYHMMTGLNPVYIVSFGK